MKVLVTGATGFIGHALVQELLRDGVQVRILKRRGTGLEGLPGERLEVADGDITDLRSVESACSGIDSVFHLAGYIAYSPSARAEMQRVNVDGTSCVLQACRTHRIRRLIHMSSVVAVGASRKPEVLNELSPYTIGPLNLGYFETKKQAEELVLSAARAGQVDAVCINPSTVYGRGDASKGSRSTQIKVAQGRFRFYTSGGAGIVAVEDVVSCLLRAWQVGRTGERYIVCGENLSIQEIFSKIAEAAGVPAPSIFLPNPVVRALGTLGDCKEKLTGRAAGLNSERAWTSILYHWFDHSKASRELGFKPKSASYAIEQSVAYMREKGMLKEN